MAESTSWVSRSAASSGQGGIGSGRQGAPVPYREGPFAYEPAVLCWCQMKSARWISWSDDNPGRRYYRCQRARSAADCRFYEWIDAEDPKFLKTLLLDLRNAVSGLKKENSELKMAAASADGCNWEEIVQMKQQIDVFHEEKIEMTEALNEKDRKIEEKDATLQLVVSKMNSERTSTAGTCRLQES
ncbi:hypothetical protein U9M48_014357 [Paspalum notatum var. saurae]|uniref:GRF-type domain-containing protein n=1 Tax=Paspalum notatum var. saurae TaxID=547442 RepID=A0AAQ3T2I3_PASNO